MLWGCAFTDESVPQQREFVLEGQTYIGNYMISYVAFGADCITHRYRCNYEDLITFHDGNGSPYQALHRVSRYFDIDASTERLIGFEYMAPPGDHGVTQSEAEEIARTAAVAFTDISQYELVTKENDIFYTFQFQKYLQGIATSEGINVIVSKKGYITALGGTMYNRFPPEANFTDAATSQKLLSSNAKAAVQARALYAVNGKYDQADVGEAFWTILDGEIQLVYSVSLSSSANAYGQSTVYVSVAEATDP